MTRLVANPKMFVAVSALFALASYYNLTTGAGAVAPSTRLTVVPAATDVMQSGPAAVPVVEKPAARS